VTVKTRPHPEEDKVGRAVAPIVQAMGLRLVDVEVTSKLVRVVADGAGGADLDLLAELSRSCSAVLDEAGLGPEGHYELEVSSPGLERSLRYPAHFEQVIGQVVRLRLERDSTYPRRLEGVVVGVDDTGIVLAGAVLDGDGDDGGGGAGGETRVAFAEIERARTVFDWQAALREGPELPARAVRRRDRRSDPGRLGAADQSELSLAGDSEDLGQAR
jgi:ribosome maturation factor RimP